MISLLLFLWLSRLPCSAHPLDKRVVLDTILTVDSLRTLTMPLSESEYHLSRHGSLAAAPDHTFLKLYAYGSGINGWPIFYQDSKRISQ